MTTAATKAKITPRMSDEAVKSKTGKTWSQWFKLLDAAGAKKMSHQKIAAHLSQNGVGPWWTQMVTVTYEQARGMRDIHQKPRGYEISVSRTVDAPIGKAFKAWTVEKNRKQWLPANLEIRKTTANKSLRITWEDGKTSLAVAFLAKSADKTQIVAQHGKLPDARAAAKMKKFWSEALERMKSSVK